MLNVYMIMYTTVPRIIVQDSDASPPQQHCWISSISSVTGCTVPTDLRWCRLICSVGFISAIFNNSLCCILREKREQVWKPSSYLSFLFPLRSSSECCIQQHVVVCVRLILWIFLLCCTRKHAFSAKHNKGAVYANFGIIYVIYLCFGYIVFAVHQGLHVEPSPGLYCEDVIIIIII